MIEIDARQLAAWLRNGDPTPLVLDVREPWELEVASLPAIAGVTAIPMGEVPGRIDELRTEGPIVCVCHHGVRSRHVGLLLERQGLGPVFNLTGGIHAWATQVDPAMAVY